MGSKKYILVFTMGYPPSGSSSGPMFVKRKVNSFQNNSRTVLILG